MIDLLEDEDKFDSFMIPLTGNFFNKKHKLLLFKYLLNIIIIY